MRSTKNISEVILPNRRAYGVDLRSGMLVQKLHSWRAITHKQVGYRQRVRGHGTGAEEVHFPCVAFCKTGGTHNQWNEFPFELPREDAGKSRK